MPQPPTVTVAIMPREKYGCAERSLRSLLENTAVPFELIYVDAGSPPPVRAAIDELLSTRDHELHRFDRYLAPFEANAVAIGAASTEYLVLADNDVYFRPGWLDAMLRCAVEESADAVSPLILLGEEQSSYIHVAAGISHIEVGSDGERHLEHLQFHEGEYQADVQLERRRTELLETHCVMARLDTWRALGDLDPTVGHPTNVDELAIRLGEVGATAWFEPEAEVVYLFGPEINFSRDDVRLMNYVWSERWVDRDFERLARAHGLEQARLHTRTRRWWLGNQRRVWMSSVQERISNVSRRLKVPFLGHLVWKACEYAEVGANRTYVALSSRAGWARDAAVAHGLRER